jgi:hypothetical protein
MLRTKSALAFAALLNLAALPALANEWEGVSPEDMGISQEEFQKVKESGMSKSKFLKLLEVGISPNEYFSEPWKKLGVTEDHWLNEKKSGMADDDIDRSYRKQDSHNMDPFVSFVLPGYYSYKTDRTLRGAALTSIAVGGIALTFLHRNEETDSIHPFYPIVAVGSMVWSAAEAYLGTRYVDNQDAARFSFDLGLTPDGGPAALMTLGF